MRVERDIFHPLRLVLRQNPVRRAGEHLRHRDIQSTTIYARLMPAELAEAVSAFDA